MITIDKLHFRYPGAKNEAIRGLSLTVPDGSLFGLLGPNGSGKTTLISLLTGSLPAAHGSITVDAKPLAPHVRSVQRFSALVPQDYAFYARLSVRDNLRFFAGALGLPRPVARQRITEAMNIAGLGSFESTHAAHLSGGLKRRLNLAIGLLNRPRLLMLDEPTVGIDPQSRQFILDAIRVLNANGTTVIYTTHYMEEVEQLCDQIAVLDSGQLLAHGTLESLLGQANNQRLSITLESVPNDTQRAALSAFDALLFDHHELKLQQCDDATVKALTAALAQTGLAINRIQYGYRHLEDLFLSLTGRGLRD